MAATALKEQLNGLVNSMFAEGLLDEQFQQLQMLQDGSNPGFVAEVVTLFCEDSERILADLTKLMDQAVVDYSKVDAYVHQLKGSSSRCMRALNVVKHEYYHLRSKFETMLQLENRIQAYETKQQN
ncbi:histidine-containing phosphotransfer protein 2 isoform X3 [Elaeis guineensis]|uniref:Histidine-containing phosphotransfer protein n=1 Tax=Elaeis guineensis var. tenera TaxID=51953 RepID=A0A6I9QI37_ELAGV|nr:histidine-containing phosphotransfer protein 2 isoform X3 [Elaeis guineensis]